MFSPADIVDAAADTLARAAGELDAEEAVRGIDDLSAGAVQQLLAEGFERAGWIVQREVRYPSQRRGSKATLVRCDMVLTNDAPLQSDAPATLFDRLEPTPPQGACWIEVRVAAANNVEGAERSYERTLTLGAMADAAVLASDPQIHHALLLMVLFGSVDEALHKDVARWTDEALMAGVPLQPPRVRGFHLRERRGNGAALVVGVPISRAGNA